MDQSDSPARLYERSTGLRAIDRLLQELGKGGSGALFFTGDAGLGKTTLLSLAAHHAGPRVRVGRARGQAMEVELPLGLAAQALEPLGGPRLCRAGSAAEPAESRVAVWVRVREWLEATASATPVLLLLDDLQWSDPDSLELVAFLSRRIRAAPVGIIAGLRPWPPAARELVDRLVADGAADAVELAPLSRPGARWMLAELLSRRPDDPDVRRDGGSPRVGVDGPEGGDLADRAWTLAGGIRSSSSGWPRSSSRRAACPSPTASISASSAECYCCRRSRRCPRRPSSTRVPPRCSAPSSGWPSYHPWRTWTPSGRPTVSRRSSGAAC
ncbi:ATP-binding protein [Actinoallomurus sp. NBC_01490]|uniref:ATP-binding protein n=1 Tax=Actinoallomurus sp. NBC_01490 TaxID=2903557 RepID=UPI002E35EA7F|nr:ATP-binding protein [Actinoallomurus sp. NBC_01490]